MGFLDLLKIYLCGVVMAAVYLHGAESGVAIHFTRVPPLRSRFSTAIFWYVVERADGSNACYNSSCSFSCKLDRRTILPCPMNALELKNLTENREHELTLGVTTVEGDRNSAMFSWFIDTIPPTVTISSNRNYTDSERVTIRVVFSEPCHGDGSFNCANSSLCDVIVYGPATVVPRSLHTLKDETDFTLSVSISRDVSQGRVIIKVADRFCTDEAGNEFVRTRDSTLVIHVDREPVRVDLWALMPSYALTIDGVPRTVYTTNKLDGMEIYLDFSISVINSTKQMLKALHTNVGVLVPSLRNNSGNRRFVFKLTDVSGSHIVKIKLRAGSIICRTGAVVSFSPSFVFLLDSSKPIADVRTTVSPATEDSSIDIVVGFNKPVFGFKSSMVDVEGGRVARFEELSRDLYAMTISAAASRKMISVSVPEAKVNDISGNPNLASNKLELMHYSFPAVSIALQSFVTVGVIATSLTVALLSLSSSSLAACVPGFAEDGISPNPPMNLHGMVGHLQVFVLSSWFTTNQQVEFSEMTKGLQWIIPHEKLPWKRAGETPWPREFYEKDVIGCYNNISVIVHHHVPISASGLLNQSNRAVGYGSPLSSDEYVMYFTRGEPLPVTNMIHGSESNRCWDEMEMNLFWVAVGGGSLIIIHLLILLLLRSRMGSHPQELLSVPRFEVVLLIITLPGIAQSSAFAINGGRMKGIIIGAILLVIPIAFVSLMIFFLAFMVFPSSLMLYKEVKHLSKQERWYKKLLSFVVGPPTLGKWFYRDDLASFPSQFGFLFEDLKGPAFYVFVHQNDPNTMPKWTESSDSGIGRMRAISSSDSNEEVKIPTSKRLFGCIRSSYIVLDICRRIILGFLAGIYLSGKSSRLLCALSITILQLVYLVTLKPYISRAEQAVESVSLLCEASLFLLLRINASRNFSDPPPPKFLGILPLALLLICYVSQIIREWYAVVMLVLRLSRPRKGSFKAGLKNLAKGLVLPFLPQRIWSRVLSPDDDEPRGGSTRIPCVESLSSMTATVVPTLSPMPDLWGVNVGQQCNVAGPSSSRPRWDDGEASKGPDVVEPRSDLRRLRELAKASFSG